MINDKNLTLALIAGIDIPIGECCLILHQPSLKEIAFFGEENFFLGLSIITISKEILEGQNQDLSQINNFMTFMYYISQEENKKKKAIVLEILSFLFPEYKIICTPRSLLFKQNDQNFIIDESNFDFLQNVIKIAFCLNKNSENDFNPSNSKAKEIAEKLKRGRQRVAKQREKEDGGAGSSLTAYISSLTVGINSMSLYDILNLTLFQLYDLVERYSLFISYDLDIKARLAGSTSEKPIDNWMKSIH